MRIDISVKRHRPSGTCVPHIPQIFVTARHPFARYPSTARQKLVRHPAPVLYLGPNERRLERGGRGIDEHEDCAGLCGRGGDFRAPTSALLGPMI